jgi:hypothetical protein
MPDKICLEYELKYVLYYFEVLEMKINLEARKNLGRSVSSDKNTYKIIQISCVICMQIFISFSRFRPSFQIQLH